MALSDGLLHEATVLKPLALARHQDSSLELYSLVLRFGAHRPSHTSPYSKVSHRLVLPQVPRMLLADRSAGRALALQNETPIPPRSSYRNLHPPIFRSTEKDSQQVPPCFPHMMTTTTSCWKSVSFGQVGRHHRLTAARAQQRPSGLHDFIEGVLVRISVCIGNVLGRWFWQVLHV